MTNELLETLHDNINEMIKMYRHLLEVVRKEKDILISAQLDQLNENNKLKEGLLLKLRKLETKRQSIVREIAEKEGLDSNSVRLLDLVVHFNGEPGDKLRNVHSVLTLLLKRIQELNLQNENLVNSALQTITGAIGSIKETISIKPTYEKKGEKKSLNENGHLVRREV